MIGSPLLPTTGAGGVHAWTDRCVLNGIFWRLRAGAPWADIPSRYGPRATCVDLRFSWWREAGVLGARSRPTPYRLPLTMAISGWSTPRRSAFTSLPPTAKKSERSVLHGRSRGGRDHQDPRSSAPKAA